MLIAPTQIGHQDLASLLARQPSVTERWRKHLIASPFGTIHAATFSLPRPVSSAMPRPLGYALASLDPNNADVAGALFGRMMEPDPEDLPRRTAVTVNRALKGDRLPERQPEIARPLNDAEQIAPIASAPVATSVDGPVAAARVEAPPAVATATPDVLDANQTAPGAPRQAPAPARPLIAAERAPTHPRSATERPPAAPAANLAAKQARDLKVAAKPVEPEAPAAVAQPEEPKSFNLASINPAQEAPPRPAPMVVAPAKNRAPEAHDDAFRNARTPASLALPPTDDDAAIRAARIYFGIDPLARKTHRIEPWGPGEQPILEGVPYAIKPNAESDEPPVTTASLPPTSPGGETIAPKGQITGADQRPMSPAERLKLAGAERKKAEKCLANAIYFESRGEVVRGQIAVAQVVINRVFTEHYPKTVCGVVYQNAHRHLACQFTFACDGKPDVIKDQAAWERATKIANETLDGKLWLPEIGKATHYHAYWVRPWWVRTMTKLHKLGVHTFYRPRKWGDGSDIPVWGDVKTTAAIAATL
jgi:spore germination cell wall hydrolase CwlJ-like protein